MLGGLKTIHSRGMCLGIPPGGSGGVFEHQGDGVCVTVRVSPLAHGLEDCTRALVDLGFPGDYLPIPLVL